MSSSLYRGVFWFICSLLTSCVNDLIVKQLGTRLHPLEIAFLRFLFGTLTLLPFIILYGAKVLHTSLPYIHVIRGALLFIAICTWIYAVTSIPIATITLIGFTIPLFTLLFAALFLHERVTLRLWMLTCLGLFGTFIVLEPKSYTLNYSTLMLLVSVAMFALLDVINKKLVIQESMLGMLFYSTFFTTIFAACPAYLFWLSPTAVELLTLLILGAGSNLILFFILKAFQMAEASTLAPLRYIELILSSALGYLFFNESPNWHTYIGALIIIPSTLFIIRSRFTSRI